MVLIRIKDGFDRFLAALDSEGVGIFQAIVYLHLAAGGAYCALIARGVPQAVEDAMGHHVNTVWLWLCIGCAVCMVGKILSGRPDRRKFWVHTTGLHLQLAGDIAALGAFAGYVLATMQSEYWGKVLLAAWLVAGLADCAGLLVMRDIRRIGQAERMVRR